MTHASFAVRSLLPVLIALVTVACGGGDPTSPTETPTTVSSVTLSPSTSTLLAGESTTLNASVTTSTGSNASTFPITWSSSTPAVATVSTDGAVRAIASGSATITATAGNKTATATVEVLSVTSIAISHASLAMFETETRDLQAVPTLSNGATGTQTVAWTSSDAAVATVTSSGRVTAVGAGNATITATIGGKTATAAIAVVRRVANIALDVTSRSLVIGEALTVKPTLTFSDNTPATGRAVTWSSNASATASVSAAGVVTGIAAGNATITASVDGRSATASITVRAPMVTTLNNAAATSATIGPKGGTLTTSASGVTYRLEVPAGALPTNTEIRMTPVVSIANLVLSGGLAAAVDLQPSGLTFARPATLRLGVSAPPRAGLTLIGFNLENNAQTFRMPATARSNEVVVSVPHFSQAGAAFGTSQDVQSMTPGTWRPPLSDPFVDTFISLAGSGGSAANLLQALIGWFDNGVLPMLQAAQNDPTLISALGEYETWATDAFAIYGTLPLSENDPALQTRRLQYTNALTAKLETAIRQNNELCSRDRSLTAMQNALFWQARAQAFGIATGALSRNAVLGDLCAKVVVVSSSFPDPVQSGFPNDLDVKFGLQFGSNPTVNAVPLGITFNSSTATFGKTSPANSDAEGAFTVAVTVAGDTPFSVSVFGCLALAGAEDVCGLHAVNGTSLDLTGPYTGRFSSTIRTGGGFTFPVNVPINVQLTQNQNGISGTYRVMQFNGPRGSVSATLSGQDLLNFTLGQFAPCTGSLTGAARVALPARTISSTYAGSDCTGTHSNGVSELAPGSTSLVDFSGAWGRDMHASGNPTFMWKIRQSGNQVFLMLSIYNHEQRRMRCAATFRGTVTPGSDVFTATFTSNISPFDYFANGDRVTWEPNLTVQRAAVVTNLIFPTSTWQLLGSPPSECSP